MFEVCYLASKSPPKTNATTSFRSILMVDCLVCGWDMNGDKRFGAIRRTRCLRTLLFVGAIIKSLNGITSPSGFSSPSAIWDLAIFSIEVYYIIGSLGCSPYGCLHKFYHLPLSTLMATLGCNS